PCSRRCANSSGCPSRVGRAVRDPPAAASSCPVALARLDPPYACRNERRYSVLSTRYSVLRGGSMADSPGPVTALVTGGAGFIGSHLVEALLQAGRSVLVVDDLSTGSLGNLEAVRDHPRLRVVVANITDAARLGELLDAADEVYHLAAVVGVRRVL